MAHFAEIDKDGVVLRVVVINNSDTMRDGIELEEVGVAYCQKLYGGSWKQTSYNGNFRKNYAGRGYTYREDMDAFIPPQPFPSWILNQETCRWEAPVPMPEDGFYYWDEGVLGWVKHEVSGEA